MSDEIDTSEVKVDPQEKVTMSYDREKKTLTRTVEMPNEFGDSIVTQILTEEGIKKQFKSLLADKKNFKTQNEMVQNEIAGLKEQIKGQSKVDFTDEEKKMLQVIEKYVKNENALKLHEKLSQAELREQNIKKQYKHVRDIIEVFTTKIDNIELKA